MPPVLTVEFSAGPSTFTSVTPYDTPSSPNYVGPHAYDPLYPNIVASEMVTVTGGQVDARVNPSHPTEPPDYVVAAVNIGDAPGHPFLFDGTQGSVECVYTPTADSLMQAYYHVPISVMYPGLSIGLWAEDAEPSSGNWLDSAPFYLELVSNNWGPRHRTPEVIYPFVVGTPYTFLLEWQCGTLVIVADDVTDVLPDGWVRLSINGVVVAELTDQDVYFGFTGSGSAVPWDGNDVNHVAFGWYGLMGRLNAIVVRGFEAPTIPDRRIAFLTDAQIEYRDIAGTVLATRALAQPESGTAGLDVLPDDTFAVISAPPGGVVARTAELWTPDLSLIANTSLMGGLAANPPYPGGTVASAAKFYFGLTRYTGVKYEARVSQVDATGVEDLVRTLPDAGLSSGGAFLTDNLLSAFTVSRDGAIAYYSSRNRDGTAAVGGVYPIWRFNLATNSALSYLATDPTYLVSQLLTLWNDNVVVFLWNPAGGEPYQTRLRVYQPNGTLLSDIAWSIGSAWPLFARDREDTSHIWSWDGVTVKWIDLTTGATVASFARTPLTSYEQFAVLPFVDDEPTPEAVFDPDEAPIGLTWVEFTDANGGFHVWSNIALPDPPEYYGGYKAHRIIEFGPIRRGLSNIDGQYEGIVWSWTMNG